MNYPQEKIKPYSNDGKKSEQVEQMFDNIAPAYDQLKSYSTLGIEPELAAKGNQLAQTFPSATNNGCSNRHR